MMSTPLPPIDECTIAFTNFATGHTYFYRFRRDQIPMVAAAIVMDANRPDTDLSYSNAAELLKLLDRVKDASWLNNPPNQPLSPPSLPPKNWWTL